MKLLVGQLVFLCLLSIALATNAEATATVTQTNLATGCPKIKGKLKRKIIGVAAGEVAADYFKDSQGRIKCEIQKSPIVTGTSVIAVRYRDGVMMAADCLASYGSLARFRDVQRLHGLSKTTLMGTSGDISDLQSTINMLKQYRIEEFCYDDGHEMTSRQWHTALAAYMYKKRSDMKPLWNSNVIAGVDPKTGEVFLGYVDLLGTTYESDSIATGFGAYLAQPLLRNAVENKALDMTEEAAADLLERCLRVLYYRDARSLDKVQFAKVTADGVTVSAPTKISSDWSIGKRGE